MSEVRSGHVNSHEVDGGLLRDTDRLKSSRFKSSHRVKVKAYGRWFRSSDTGTPFNLAEFKAMAQFTAGIEPVSRVIPGVNSERNR